MKKLYILLSVLSVLSVALVLMVTGTTKHTLKKHLEVSRKENNQIHAKHPEKKQSQSTKKELKYEVETDRPDLAMAQEFEMTKDPALGAVPYERLLTANKAVAESLRQRGPIAGVTWQERGPNNIGGRTRALMFDPNDATKKKVWAGGVSGGLWFTNDITANPPVWNHVNDFWDNLIVCNIAYNPANTQEFYVGTGEGWFNADAQRGGGIWKTSDGGVTWANLPATYPGAYNSSSHFHYVNKIVIKNDGTIFAATRGYFTNTGGIMRSIDGGANWTRVLSQYVSGTYRDWAADIEIAANGDLYASMGISSAGQVYKSLNASNGASGTWTNLSANIGMAGAKRVELACAPSSSNVIYAVAQGGSGDNDVEWFKKSIDGGTTWSTLPIPLMVDGTGNHFTRSQAFYDLILAVHPTNSNLVIVGGIDLHRTTDGGTNWSGISHWYGGFGKPEVHADQHAIIFRPGASNEMLFGNDGGIYYSTNAGNSSATPSFTSKNTSYNVTQFYACAAKNETASNYFLAGAQDNGSHKFTLPQIAATTSVSGGDGAFCHIDQLNPNIQMTAYTNNNLYRSLDGGNSFPSLISESTGHFINPSDYDSQRKILYLAADNDQLKRISGMDGTITNTDITISVGTAMVSAVKVSPYNDVVFLGIENGRVYKYSGASTGAPTLTRIDNGALPINTAGWVSCIEVGANDNQILVTYSNYGVTSVWETANGGANWYSKEGNLPDMPVRWALYNPDNRNQVLLATEVGVWSTDNFGAGTSSVPVWGVSSTNLAYTRCTMLKYRPADKMVVVSSHGRGLFTSDIFVTTPVADFVTDQSFTCSGSLTVHFTDGSLKPNGSWAWDINNDGITDYTTQNPTHTYSSPGLYSVKLTINNGGASITKQNLIMVMSSEPTVNTGCALVSNSNLNNNNDIGIHRFAIGGIDYSTSYNDGYYQNYCCSKSTTLSLNQSYNVTIATGTLNAEGARVYIDYNDNGIFDAAESVVSFPSNTAGTRTLSFTTPSSGVVFDKGLRLRVLSKFGSIPTSACNISTYGQAEDYTVYFESPVWNGSTNTDWFTATNWSINAIPASGVNVKIPTGRPNYPVLTNAVTCGNLTIETGASLTVNSGIGLTVNGTLLNSAGNAGIIVKSGGSLIESTTGVSATVERDISGAEWHLISAPVSGAVSGMFTGKYLQKHSESTNAYTDIKILTEALTPEQGFALYNASGFTAQYTGTLNTGLQSITTSYSGSGKGWNLVGNPYPSSIDWNATTGWTKSNVNGSVYIHKTASTWATFNGTTGTNGGSRYIAPCQGFFVEANAAGSLAMTNSVKVHNATPFYKNAEDAVSNLIRLEVSGNGYTDETVVWFLPESTPEFDGQYDAHKLFGDIPEAPQIYSLGSSALSINTLPETTTVPVGLHAETSGNYSIAATEINDFSDVSLEDTKTGIFTNLTKQAYTFNVLTGENEQRFILHFGPLSVAETDNSQFNIYSNSHNVFVDLKNNSGAEIFIYTISGQKIVTAKGVKGMNTFNMNTAGNYIVKIVCPETSLVKKVWIQ